MAPPLIQLKDIALTFGGTPLLTDRRTAQAMNVPYTALAGGIALVQPRDARTSPGVTVIPAEGLAAAPPSRETVITEMREPPAATNEQSVMGNAAGLSSIRPAR